MNGFALLLATAVLGVDYGWQPASDGRLEYIIQLEPVTLIALREGQEVVSQIDPFVRDVRRFRIRVGTDVVPRLGTPVPESTSPPTAAASAPPPGVTYGWQPVNAQQVELIVQIAPDRLVALQNEAIVGEIPPELRSVARVRIRSGAVELPRQNLPPAAPTANAGSPGSAPVAGAGGSPGIASGAVAAGVAGAATAANAGSSWPANNRGSTAKQPSRYDPPSNAPAPTAAAPVDPRTNASSAASQANPSIAPPAGAGMPQNPNAAWQPPPGQNTPLQQPDPSWQNAAGQNPNASWSASGQPVAGGLSLPMPPANQPPANAALQPAGAGLSDPGGSRGWDSGAPVAGSYAGVQPPATTSPAWGTPDDRFTTERGQLAGNVPPAGAAASSWTPMVSLPQGPTQPTSPAWPSQPPSSSRLPSFAGSAPAGEMVSPFADPLTTANRSSDALASLTQPPWAAARGSLTEAGFSEDTSKKKLPDFWADLAEAANDPSVGFLREAGDLPSIASDKPWWPLTLAMLALFASMGGNLYMGWIAVDVYRRYLEMADDGDEEEDEDAPRQRDQRRDWEDQPRRRERVAVED
ncbi:MAG: hypothetical protein MUE50_22480 [Pirellulaceae bacterium]|nr:hypothetical protein [Pirellulaceae bacterium]